MSLATELILSAARSEMDVKKKKLSEEAWCFLRDMSIGMKPLSVRSYIVYLRFVTHRSVVQIR
jgi:hypothetical protein